MSKTDSALIENILLAAALTNRNPALDSLQVPIANTCAFAVIKNLSATLPLFINTQSNVAIGLTQGQQVEPLQVWTEEVRNPAELAITTPADAGAIVSLYGG